MTARHVTALAFVAVLLWYFGFVLPSRTEAVLARLREQLARDPGARVKFYLRYVVLSVLVVAAYAVTVLVGGEGFDDAGAGWPENATRRLLPGGVAALVVVDAGLLGTFLAARRLDPDALRKENQHAKVDFLVPGTARERALWPLVCVAIGVLEEVVYRGLFVLYAARLLDVSPWWLLAPTSVLFGLAHRYQGWLGVVTTGWLGLGFGILTIVTGSLWPAVVAHALADLRLLFLRPPAPRTTTPAAGSAPPPPPPG